MTLQITLHFNCYHFISLKETNENIEWRRKLPCISIVIILFHWIRKMINYICFKILNFIGLYSCKEHGNSKKISKNKNYISFPFTLRLKNPILLMENTDCLPVSTIASLKRKIQDWKIRWFELIPKWDEPVDWATHKSNTSNGWLKYSKVARNCSY